MTDGFKPYYNGGQPGGGAPSTSGAKDGKELLLVGVNGSLSGGKGLNLFPFGPFGIGKGSQGVKGPTLGFFGDGISLPLIIHR